MDQRVTHPQNEYGRYCLPEGLEHRPAVQMVREGKVYEPDTLAFMRAHAGQGDIIHAGAFFGDFLPALSGGLAPGATLWAFEPNPGNHTAAAETMRINDLGNVTLANAALSNRSGEIRFRTHTRQGEALGGKSHFVEGDGEDDEEGVTRVKAVMLDYIVPLEREVSILQLDVEGHEKEALKGAYHIISTWRPILIIEYFSNAQWITRTFRGLGYEKRGKLHGNHVYACHDVAV